MECVVWQGRARRAARYDDAEEAGKLLKLAALLDARTHARQTVPGIFDDNRPSRAA